MVKQIKTTQKYWTSEQIKYKNKKKTLPFKIYGFLLAYTNIAFPNFKKFSEPIV